MERRFNTTSLLILGVCWLSFSSLAQVVDVGGTSFEKRDFSLGEGQPALSVFDFNHDNHVDLIVANYNENTLSIFQGDGKGRLTLHSKIPSGENPTGIDTQDINNDGHMDIVVANHETSYITVLLGDGKGSFKKPNKTPLETDLVPHPHVVRLVDLNYDEHIDLLVDSRDDNGLRLYKGLGNGHFSPKSELIKTGGDPYRGFAIGDLNRDKRIDIVTPNQRDIGIVLAGVANGESFSVKHLPQKDSPFSVELADVNNDDKLDIIVASNTAMSMLPGDGDGTFPVKRTQNIGTFSGAKQIAIGDLNGDGIDDAMISVWAGKVYFVLGGDKKLGITHFKPNDLANPWGIVMADFNEDGKDDFVIADGNSNKAAIYLSVNKLSKR